MAYFDSSKNRALWEIELQSLRKLRAEREAGKEVDILNRREAKQNKAREPIPMTYKELLREEAVSVQRNPHRDRVEMQSEKKERQKEARFYEMH